MRRNILKYMQQFIQTKTERSFLKMKRVNEINFACHLDRRESAMTLEILVPQKKLSVIYNLNFIKVISAFFFPVTSRNSNLFNKKKKHNHTEEENNSNFFSCLQHCYSNKYTKLNRICIEIGLKTLFSLLIALSLLLELNTKKKTAKNVAIRIAFQHLLAWTFISFDVAVLFNLIW